MKTILITACLLLFTSIAIGQNLEITFTGLEKAGSQTKVEASTIQFLGQPSSTTGTTRGSGNKIMTYVVTRNSNAASSAIEKAYVRGIGLSKVTIIIKNVSGQSIHTLTNASIISYGVEYKSNKNHVEEFTLSFESRQVK